MDRLYRAIGLMSGTSADGIDAALIETDGEALVRSGPCLSEPYDTRLSSHILETLEAARNVEVKADGTFFPTFADTEKALSEAHAQIVNRLLGEAGLKPSDIDVVGFHGQTILHRPEVRLTWQLGDGALLARQIGIDVVNDFRQADVKTGGQGAPLTPLYHAALGARVAERPLCVLNLGGVANVTWIGAQASLAAANDILAFDTGPANAPVNDWVCAHTGAVMDENGHHARQGRVDEDRLQKILSHSYFSKPAPKSLDRFDFGANLAEGLSLADGAATLTAFCAAAVAAALVQMPSPPRLWVVCGGGRHNEILMSELRARLPGKIVKAEDVGWRGDVLEAEAFAYLAVRSLKKLPLSVPRTTGVPQPLTGGRLHRHAAA